MAKGKPKGILNSELVEKLVSSGEKLSTAVASDIASRGSDVIPDLIAIMQDEELTDIESPGEGCVPLHALAILRRMKATEAIEPMLKLLKTCESDDIMYSELGNTLESFGEVVLEPVLKALAEADTAGDTYQVLLETLCGIGVRDQRIMDEIIKQLESNAVLASYYCVKYEDPSLLPHLYNFLNKCKHVADGGESCAEDVVEISAAIESLGGKLSPPQTKLLRGARSYQARQRALVNQSERNSRLIPLTRPGVGVKLF